MKSPSLSLLAGAMLALAAAAPAHAATTTFTAVLDGAAEVPANLSGATGSGTVTFDDVLNSIAVSMSFTGLSAPASASHIHCCAAPGANAGVALGLTSFPAATAGTYTNTFTSGFSGAHTFASLLTNANSGLAYFNIHNATFPGGEIRGQLVPIPEPATYLLMAMGLGAVGALVRRRQGT